LHYFLLSKALVYPEVYTQTQLSEIYLIRVPYLAPLVLLLVSLVAAFAVFFPERFRINILSSQGSQATYEAIVKSKLSAMRVATVFLLLGIGGITMAMFVYLT
jgi:hypothetical protein